MSNPNNKFVPAQTPRSSGTTALNRSTGVINPNSSPISPLGNPVVTRVQSTGASALVASSPPASATSPIQKTISLDGATNDPPGSPQRTPRTRPARFPMATSSSPSSSSPQNSPGNSPSVSQHQPVSAPSDMGVMSPQKPGLLNVGEQPVSQAVDENSTTIQCSRCEEAEASRHCEQCKQNFCQDCSVEVHSVGKWKTHVLSSVTAVLGEQAASSSSSSNPHSLASGSRQNSVEEMERAGTTQRSSSIAAPPSAPRTSNGSFLNNSALLPHNTTSASPSSPQPTTVTTPPRTTPTNTTIPNNTSTTPINPPSHMVRPTPPSSASSPIHPLSASTGSIPVHNNNTTPIRPARVVPGTVSSSSSPVQQPSSSSTTTSLNTSGGAPNKPQPTVPRTSTVSQPANNTGSTSTTPVTPTSPPSAPINKNTPIDFSPEKGLASLREQAMDEVVDMLMGASLTLLSQGLYATETQTKQNIFFKLSENQLFLEYTAVNDLNAHDRSAPLQNSQKVNINEILVVNEVGNDNNHFSLQLKNGKTLSWRLSERDEFVYVIDGLRCFVGSTMQTAEMQAALSAMTEVNALITLHPTPTVPDPPSNYNFVSQL